MGRHGEAWKFEVVRASAVRVRVLPARRRAGTRSRRCSPERRTWESRQPQRGGFPRSIARGTRRRAACETGATGRGTRSERGSMMRAMQLFMAYLQRQFCSPQLVRHLAYEPEQRLLRMVSVPLVEGQVARGGQVDELCSCRCLSQRSHQAPARSTVHHHVEPLADMAAAVPYPIHQVLGRGFECGDGAQR